MTITRLPRRSSANRDNTVSFQNLTLQIERVKWRGTLAGCNVTLHQHFDQTLSITYGPHSLGRFTAQGQAIPDTAPATRKAMEKKLRGKAQKPAFPQSFEIPQTPRDSNYWNGPPLVPATVYLFW
jgi:hypothetical protein